jgi:hypothetical protein
MGKMNYDVVAELKFITTNEGGRTGATPSNFLNCIFVFRENNYDCRLLLEDIGHILPGDFIKQVPIVFFHPELIKENLKVNDIFSLRELNIIANGKILAITS